MSHTYHGKGPIPDFYVNFLREKVDNPEVCDLHVFLVAKDGTEIATKVIPHEMQVEIGADPVWVAVKCSGISENICAYLFPDEYSRVRRRIP